MATDDPKDLVRRGYDGVSARYDEAHHAQSRYRPLVDEPLRRLPVAEQPPLLGRIATWLRPGGLFVASTGQRALTGVEEDWLGGGVPMWWSHTDTATNRGWIERAGPVVDSEEFLPEGSGGHALFWAHRPPAPDPAGPVTRETTEV